MLALREILATVIIFDQRDRWFWLLDGSGEFSVTSGRNYIDSKTLVVDHSSTRWNTLVPIKVNIFTWRLILINEELTYTPSYAPFVTWRLKRWVTRSSLVKWPGISEKI